MLLGVEIVNPFSTEKGGMPLATMSMGLISPFETPTGLAVKRVNTEGQANKKPQTIQISRLIAESLRPAGKDGVTRIKTDGFSIIQPIPGSIKCSPNGDITMRFLNPSKLNPSIKTIDMTNEATNKRCEVHLRQPNNDIIEDYFEATAQGCYTDYDETERVISYDVSIEYDAVIGNIQTARTSRGRIQLWV
jgi:hypothetical protein